MTYLKDIKFTCDDHQLDVACLGCIKVLLNKKNALLKFVKELAWLHRYSDLEMEEFYKHGSYLEAKEARELLKEIGEL